MRRSLTGTSLMQIDGATPKVCWTLGAVMMKFSFAIALLYMAYLVKCLMVLCILFQWFPIIWTLAREKQTKSANALDDQMILSSGIKIGRAIGSFLMRMLYLEKQINLNLLHCV